MKKLKYLSLIMVATFMLLPNVKALDYVLPSKFAGKESNNTFWLSSGERLSGSYYYERPTNTSVGDYLDISYCSTGNVTTYTLNRDDIQRDPINIDTGMWCTTGEYSGTIKHSYFLVSQWTYTEDSGYAYIEGSDSYFYNSSSYNAHVLFYGIANISELDMSLAILAYLKSQEEQIDYTSALNQIQSNTSQYNEEIGIVQDKLDETNTSINAMKEAISSTDTSNSQEQANSFFEGFESDDYGLSDIITMPLDLIKGLTSNTCVALNLTLPFVNKSFELPCMSEIYSSYFGDLFSLYQLVTFGFVAYWVVVKIFALVKGFKDPDDDKVEVLDL